jgi:hypothetical protein
MTKKNTWLRALLMLMAAVFCLVLLMGASGYLVFVKYPSIGALGSDDLRKVIGDEAVARLESLVFQAEDTLHRLQYRAGGLPQPPWSTPTAVNSVSQESVASQAAVALQTADALNRQAPQSSQPLAAQVTGTPPRITGSGVLPKLQPTPLPPKVTPENVCPPSVSAIGTMKGEGVWSPYLTDDSSGRVAACRTFFQPDPERLYAIAAVVAFDLDTVSLHYVLGSQEPASTVPVDRPGVISPADMKPNVLLAVFNGGFKARHGHFGVMANGVIVIPPKDGFGTIAMYKNGVLRIGAWGSDILPSPDIVFWRQNGPLLVQNGQINPRIYNQSPQDWGSSLDGKSPVATWRSAMGISADGKTMYYAAGPSLTLQSLAQSLITAGASQAVQLDINNYWVYFGQVVFDASKPNTIPLFPEWQDNPNRYLQPYSRDFFYVTAK